MMKLVLNIHLLFLMISALCVGFLSLHLKQSFKINSKSENLTLILMIFFMLLISLLMFNSFNNELNLMIDLIYSIER